MDQKLLLTKLACEQLGIVADKSLVDKQHKIIWQNTRKKEVGGNRLTDEGYRIFIEDLGIKSYSIEFPSELTITNQITIWLDRFIDGPYYLTKKSIIVFKEKTAVQLILFSGDVQKFGIAKAMSDRTFSKESEKTS